MVGLALEEPVFSRGQLYVAYYRVGSSKNIVVHVQKHALQGCFDADEGVAEGTYTSNVVWEDALPTKLARPSPECLASNGNAAWEEAFHEDTDVPAKDITDEHADVTQQAESIATAAKGAARRSQTEPEPRQW